MEIDTTFMCGDFSDDNIMSLAGPADGSADARAADTAPQAKLDGDDEGLGGYGMEPFELPYMTTEEFDGMVYEALGGAYSPEAEAQEPTEEEGPQPTDEEELELTEEEELKREEEALERERNARQLEEDIFRQRDEAQRLTAESLKTDRIEVDPMNWDGNEMRPRQETSTGPVVGGALGTETAGPAEGDLATVDTGDTIVAHPVEEEVVTTNAGGAKDAGASNATGDTITVATVDRGVAAINAGSAEDAGIPNATDSTTGVDAAPTNESGTNTTTAKTTTDKKLCYFALELRAQAIRRAKRALAEEQATPSGSPPPPYYHDSGVRPPNNASSRHNRGRNGNTAGHRPSTNSGARPGGNTSRPHNHRRDINRAGQRPRAPPIAGQSRFTGGPVMGYQRFAEIPVSGPQQSARVPIAGPLQRPVGPAGGTAPSHQGPIYRAGPPGTLSLVPDGDMVWGYLSIERLTCVIQLPHGFEGVSPIGRAGLLWRGYFDARGDGQWRHHGSTHMTMGQNLRFLAGGRVEGQVNCGEAGAMKFLATTVRGGSMGQEYSAGQMRRQWAVMGPRGN